MKDNRLINETDASTDEPPPVFAAEPVESSALQTSLFSSMPVQADFSRWNSWTWQMQNRIRSVARLRDYFPGLDAKGIHEASAKFPFAITPYYASLIRRADHTDPVFAQSVPQMAELFDPACLKEDPLEEDEDMGVPGLVHRYQDRALLISTSSCAMYCRHCTRKRVAGRRDTCITRTRLERAVKYLSMHPEIHDVIISGGDPLTMSTEMLETVIAAVRSVKSVDVIRIGTRTPVVLPMRITNDLVNMLKKYHPIFINTHFNHPVELTPQAIEACGKLADAGIPLGNQSVLLKGINDDPRVMEELLRSLLKARVKPYYLFQCDLVRGVEHFRTPISKGIEIMEYLRGRVSGLGIPTYVVDAPHGGGKIPVLPNYIVSTSPTHTVLRNFEGQLVSYPEPGPHNSRHVQQAAGESAAGIWELASGRHTKIQPQNSARLHRREARKQTAAILSAES
ncbi:MAG: KamA family radical SAM protein [Kiritimatiellia bacterium]